MGNVAVTLKIMPESPEVDMAGLRKKIEQLFEEFHEAKLQQISEMPIGFGLAALQVLLVLPDTAGGSDAIEKAISAIEGVASVESEGVTLI
ncbi:MAG: elongation factor 1-beta [Candidatus Aenigmarchaeota archaeon]|nr:elongation factor 1-beta [Candidatus Aenigmarchaeota archaeon]